MHSWSPLLLISLAFGLGWCQDRVKYSYLPEDMPNPQSQPRLCGLGLTAGFICDPNGILSRHEYTVNFLLNGTAYTSGVERCPCSRYHCENSRPPRFYKVAVALIPSLRLTRDTQGKEIKALDQAINFAYRLESELWNFGSCEEDIVILYSRDDNVLVTMTGATAKAQLDDRSRQYIHAIVGRHFSEGRIVEGLNRMIYEMNLVLVGNQYPYRIAELTAAGGTRVTLTSIMGSVLLVAMSLIVSM